MIHLNRNTTSLVKSVLVVQDPTDILVERIADIIGQISRMCQSTHAKNPMAQMLVPTEHQCKEHLFHMLLVKEFFFGTSLVSFTKEVIKGEVDLEIIGKESKISILEKISFLFFQGSKEKPGTQLCHKSLLPVYYI